LQHQKYFCTTIRYIQKSFGERASRGIAILFLREAVA
jgi:hypothetical protein